MSDTPNLAHIIADVDGRFWERHPELGSRKLDPKQDPAELSNEWNSLLQDRVLELVRMLNHRTSQARRIDLGA